MPNVSYKTILEYMTKNIETPLQNKVTTIEKLTITKKEPLDETLFKNGAHDRSMLELFLTKEALILYEEIKLYNSIEKS